MKLRVAVYLNDGDMLHTDSYEDDFDSVQRTVQQFLQAEGQGSFVVETNHGWCCVPTRNIKYIEVVKEEVDA